MKVKKISCPTSASQGCCELPHTRYQYHAIVYRCVYFM